METKDILKALRKSKGFANAKDFCDAADISYNTYQNYETGKRLPTAEMLMKIANFPRTCGGDPNSSVNNSNQTIFSPHLRG